jgi:hypothetical protein
VTRANPMDMELEAFIGYRRRVLRRRRIWTSVVVASVLMVLATAGGAFGWFSSVGHGTGSADAAAIQAITLSPATETTPLYPGADGDVSLTVANPNGVSVKIPSLVLDTSQGTNGLSVDAGHLGCSLSGVQFNAANATIAWTVPANATAYPIDIASGVTLLASADNACQSATFTVYLKVGP